MVLTPIPITILAPAFAVLAACATAPMGGQGAAHYTCALTAQSVQGDTQVTATLTANRDTTGQYALSIGQRGGGGAAMIDQGGGFEAAAGTTLMLGEVQLSGGGLSGQFTVTTPQGTTQCPITGPLTAHN